MEEITTQCCLSCLCTEDEFNINELAIQCEPLIAIFQVDKISLCYVCTRLLQHTEMFVKNVQSNQILFKNLHRSVQSTWPQVQPSIALSVAHLPNIEVMYSGDEQSVFNKDLGINQDLEINQDMEMKQEPKEELDQSEEFNDGSDDFQDSIKNEEENFPLNSLKEEFELELDIIDSKQKSLQKMLKRKKVKKKFSKDKKAKKIKEVIKEFPLSNTRVHITEAQCIAELRVVRAQEGYLSSEYRCDKCVQGFALKNTYSAHLARHSSSRGDFECSICTLRFKTEAKLTAHKQKHMLRYRCPQCDLICTSFANVKEHFKAQHIINDFYDFPCPQCPKVFTRSCTLRKHMYYRHSATRKVCCELCYKIYANKETLRKHMIGMHSTPAVKRHRCNECGLSFRTTAQLKSHGLKHTDLRPFFCVECDKSFKSASRLSIHLKTTAKHINYAELPYHCDNCDERFAVKRNLIRHINQTHLNIKPYACDKCDKTYINKWNLNDHKRYKHEGCKRPLRYPCSMCDKVFDRNEILKSHVRTHTGERPYQCSRCPAAFGQSSALGTHVRLVHLKLTRAGRPKT